MRKKKSGQGTLEYILVLVVILAAIILGSGQIKDVIANKLFPAAANEIATASNVLTAAQAR